MNGYTPTKFELLQLRLGLKLGGNVYPGRGIVLGTSEDGLYAVQIYWIMGRSENSRNRVFQFEGGRLFTVPFDPAKVKDPSLIIYNAMDDALGNRFVVSNGSQTDAVINSIHDCFLNCGGYDFARVLSRWNYEPDAPNFTPRITAESFIRHGKCLSKLSILRKSEFLGGDGCERFYYEYDDIAPGIGFCIHTYGGDGNPLPAFTGEPYSLAVCGNINEVAETYWSVLNKENRVSLAVKFIEIATVRSQIKVINRYPEVEPTKA